MADVLPLGDFSSGMPNGMSPEQLAALMQVLSRQQGGDAPSVPAQATPAGSLLAGALSGAPSMIGGQMPAPQMPEPAQPEPSPLARMPTLLGLQPPQMPPNGNNGRPAGIPPTATPANAAAGKAPDAGDDEDTPVGAGLAAPKPPTTYTGLPSVKPVAAPSAVPGAPTPGVSASPVPTAGVGPGSTAAPGAPSRPANASPAVTEPSIFKRLGDAGIGDTLLAMGGGLLSGRNWNEGLGNAFQGAARAGQVTAASNLANAKAQAEQAKLARELQAQNQTAQIIARRMGIPVDDATALATNPQFVQNFLQSQYGAQEGRMRNADGSMAVITGSAQDPGQVAADAAARRESPEEAARRAGLVTAATEANQKAKPISVSPGTTVLDGENYQPVYTAAPKQDPTALQSDYEYAKRTDGYKGTFEDFATQRGNQTRAQTTFNNTVNPILEAAGDRFKESLKGATAAQGTVRALQEARSQLDAPGGIFSGQWANEQLALQKMGQFFGAGDPNKITNTETFRTQIKPIVLETVKGLGAGSGISNADRDFALDAVGGNITLNEPAIRRVLDITERANREKIERHNAMAGGLINGENGATYRPVASSLLVQQPDAAARNPDPGPAAGAQAPQAEAPQGIMQIRSQAEYAAAPRGARYIAPDGKLRVKQ